MKKGEDTVQKKEVKAILFDMDGTLADSFKAWFYVYNDALSGFGFRRITENEFKKRFGSPIEKDVKEEYPGCTINQVEKSYNRNFLKRINIVKLFPEVKSTLKKLRNKKYKLALITGSTEAITASILQRFNLRKYFDIILTMKDVKRRKPAPDVVYKACKLLKVKPKNTILVGDTKNDTIAGKKAGCITVGYKINGDYKINRLSGIFNILK